VTCPISRLMLGGLLVCTNPWLARAAFAADDRAPAEAPAASRAVTPVRLLVFASAPGFAARVRGQLSGLDVTLELETAMPPGPSTERTDALLELAARHTADVIAWLDEAADDASAGPRGCVVHVWIAGRPSLHSRRIGPARRASPPPHRGADDHHASTLDTASGIDLGDGDERSASLETAALVVRGAVRAVSFERSGARASTNDLPPELELRNASPPLAVTTPKPASASQSPPLEDTGLSVRAGTPSAARAPAWAPHAGLQWSFAGLNPTGRWSLDAGVAVRTGRLSAGVAGSWSFPEVVQYQSVELRLGRQTLLAEVGWTILQTERFALQPSLGAGAAWFSRSSSTDASDRSVTPEGRSISALVAVQLEADYALTRALHLSLSSGFDWLSHVPRYVIVVPANEPTPVLEPWRWQPNVGIALGAIF
jgi:hypothetical protein